MTSLSENLRCLGFLTTDQALTDLIAKATEKRWSHMQLVEHFITKEAEERAARTLLTRHKRSRIGSLKPMTHFDWAWPQHIDRSLLEAVLSLDFLDSARNVVLVGASGLGKTMVAKNIVQRAVASGRTALFITASDLLLDLNSKESSHALRRRFAFYAGVALLVIDEVGFIPFSERNGDLLFQIVSRRYEKKSIVLTTNLAFADWPTVFPGNACTSAIVERLIHHCDVIKLEGESFRLREAREDTTRKRG